MSLKLSGSMVAIVTPFRDGKVDEHGLKKLIEQQIEAGTSAIVPCGTTGESATLSHAEHDRVIELTVEAVKGRVPVIAGTGSNNTAEAIRLTKHALDCGADASLQISPYYNKPTQEGLFQHFKAISEAVDLPLIPYNIASRTGVNMLPQTVARIAEACPNVIGIKEASGNLEQMSQIQRLTGGRLALLSGDDALSLPVISVGGTGVISVAANLVPGDVAAMVQAALNQDWVKARQLHEKLLPLIKALFIETNPIPIKAAMSEMGWISGEVRLPLTPISSGGIEVLRTAMADYGISTGSGKPLQAARRS